MKPFSESSTCPKCSHAKVSINWCPSIEFATKPKKCVCVFEYERAGRSAQLKGLSATATQNEVLDKYRGEHMGRQCKRCGFRWAERPLDRCAPLEQLASQAE